MEGLTAPWIHSVGNYRLYGESNSHSILASTAEKRSGKEDMIFPLRPVLTLAADPLPFHYLPRLWPTDAPHNPILQEVLVELNWADVSLPVDALKTGRLGTELTTDAGLN